ncbi:MAG: nucleotide-binding protein, partial [Bacteroidota bacterium]
HGDIDHIAGPDKSTALPATVAKAPKPAGTLSILDLTTNPKAYSGQTVTLHGKVTKVNPQIMNRNWIHLQDGTADDIDLVITSTAEVAAGSVVTIKGTVVLNKDFGAGYSYALLVEDGELIK